MIEQPQWQPMETAPRDGSEFVVKRAHKYGPDNLIVQWSDYADAEGGFWLPEGAVIPYQECAGWWPIPQD